MAEKKEDKKVGRRIPFSYEAEQAVLGAALISQDAPSIILTELNDKDFYAKSHQIIFKTMQELYEQRNQIVFDYIILGSELEARQTLETVGGIEYLITLTNCIPSAANFDTYVDIVKRDSVLRKLINAGTDIINDAYGSTDKNVSISLAEGKIYDIARTFDRSNLEHIKKSLQLVIDDFELAFQDPSSKRGLITDIAGLDFYTNGLQKGDLIILAARPSFGKSALAMNIAQNVALKGKSVAVFSLEMPRVQLARRMACSVAKVSMAKTIRGELNDEEQRNFRNGIDKLAVTKIFIDDSSMNTPADILSKCRRLKNESSRGLDFVVIDYLQLMSGGASYKAESRQQEVSSISRNLKIIAKELNVPVLVLSQLSRAVDSRATNDHRPQLNDLRETGAIEQDADIVMFIHRPSRYNDIKDSAMDQDEAILILAKHRNGALADIPLHWDGDTTTFSSTQHDLEMASIEKSAPALPEKYKKAFEQVTEELKGKKIKASTSETSTDEVFDGFGDLPPEDSDNAPVDVANELYEPQTSETDEPDPIFE